MKPRKYKNAYTTAVGNHNSGKSGDGDCSFISGNTLCVTTQRETMTPQTKGNLGGPVDGSTGLNYIDLARDSDQLLGIEGKFVLRKFDDKNFWFHGVRNI